MFNVLSLSDSFIQAFQSISRNKRRSLAMISGIVLGVSILSGIIIYTSELQSDNFESIIGNTEYEVSFRLIENIDSEAKLWEIARLLDDPRVESYTVITGPETASLFSQEADLFSIKISSELDFLEEELTQFTPLFIRDNFTDTTIYDQVVQKDIEGSFDLGDTSINSTVIPDIVARKFNLKVGDIIEHMNLTIIEDKGSLGHGRLADTSGERAEMMFTNIVVKGIYSSVDDNLFSNFQAAKFYFNTAILEQYGGEVNPLIKSNSNYILAVKLNTDEFSVNDVDTLDLEIDTFINDIGELSIDPSTGDDAVVGNNNIKSKLLPFEFLNLFLVIFDVILVLPMIILCLYLLIFGLTLSLEERRREIGIYKVQGANVNQIFNILRNEAYVLFIMGTIIGYVISIFGAWIIASSTSFMRFDISDTDELWDYVGIDVLALSVSSISIFVIMIIAINKRGKGFINMEVSEAVKRLSVNKANFFVRNDIDLFMVGYGLISSAVMIIDEETVFFDRINFDPTSTLWTIIFRVIGTVFLWMGAAIAGGRLSKWLPQKTEGIFLSLPKLRNIGLIIRSGLKRRGDVNNLVLIIVLTLSITSLAGIQGNSDYNQNLKMLEYEIGADFKVNFAAPSFYRSAIITIPGIDTVMELPFVPATILSQNSLVYGFNPANISEFIWHDDGFDHRGLDEVLDDFATVDAVPEVILGSSIAQSLRAEIDDTFNIKVTIIDPPANTSNIARLKVKVIGIFDHAPGE